MNCCWVLPSLLLQAALAASVTGPVAQSALSSCTKSACAAPVRRSLLQVVRDQKPSAVHVKELGDADRSAGNAVGWEAVDRSVQEHAFVKHSRKHRKHDGVKSRWNGDDNSNKSLIKSKRATMPAPSTHKTHNKSGHATTPAASTKKATTTPKPQMGNCMPMCQWSCTEPSCEETCTPECEAPTCETRCSTVDLHGCKLECVQPECSTICPKTPCLGGGGHHHHHKHCNHNNNNNHNNHNNNNNHNNHNNHNNNNRNNNDDFNDDDDCDDDDDDDDDNNDNDDVEIITTMTSTTTMEITIGDDDADDNITINATNDDYDNVTGNATNDDYYNGTGNTTNDNYDDVTGNATNDDDYDDVGNLTNDDHDDGPFNDADNVTNTSDASTNEDPDPRVQKGGMWTKVVTSEKRTPKASFVQRRSCPKCITTCSNPRCKLTCPQEQKCKAICETPKCKWNCKKPKVCPKPKCTLECAKPSDTCNKVITEPLPPLKKGEIKVANFEPKMSLLQTMTGLEDSDRTSAHKSGFMVALMESGDGASRFIELPMSA